MKYVIVIAIFISLVLNDVTQAQFKDDHRPNPDGFQLSTYIGMGAIVDSKKNFSLYQTSITVQPEQVLANGRFKLSAVGKTIISDSATQIFGGVAPSVMLFQNALKTVSFWLGLNALIGTKGTRLYGGNITLDFNDVLLSIEASQEYKSKSAYLGLNLGYSIIDPNKDNGSSGAGQWKRDYIKAGNDF